MSEQPAQMAQVGLVKRTWRIKKRMSDYYYYMYALNMEQVRVVIIAGKFRSIDAFKSERTPPQHESLNAFKEDLCVMVKSIKIRNTHNAFR